MLLYTGYQCAYCGAKNQAEVDISSGKHQEFIEDCEICCRPNFLRVDVSKNGHDALVEAVPENG